MDTYIRWFQRFIWIGIAMNMVFAIPALFAPGLLTSVVGLPPQLSDPWLENAGMLLVGISVFYMPSGFNAPRYVVHSWLCVLTRLIAVIFWIYLINTSIQGSVFVPMLMGDLSFFLILGILLYLGTTPEIRPWALLCNGWREWRAAWQRQWQSHAFKVGTLVVVAVLGFIGYETWYQMLRVVPEQEYASDEDHYKYAAIGLGIEARIPYYLFAVLPQMCPEKMPKPGVGKSSAFSSRTARTCRSVWPNGRLATRPSSPTVRCATPAPTGRTPVMLPSTCPVHRPTPCNCKPSNGSPTIAPAIRNSPPMR